MYTTNGMIVGAALKHLDTLAFYDETNLHEKRPE